MSTISQLLTISGLAVLTWYLTTLQPQSVADLVNKNESMFS